MRLSGRYIHSHNISIIFLKIPFWNYMKTTKVHAVLYNLKYLSQGYETHPVFWGKPYHRDSLVWDPNILSWYILVRPHSLDAWSSGSSREWRGSRRRSGRRLRPKGLPQHLIWGGSKPCSFRRLVSSTTEQQSRKLELEEDRLNQIYSF